ncbi:MAG: adenosine deaminase [Spirochaetia bacterium]|nr:adenosine deaminase [Spirochaetia bacterium]
MIPIEIIKQVPKVELHDHLDGSMRARTIIELAKEANISLPTYDEKELEQWFARGCERKSLPLYLETFSVSVSVLQTAKALKRAAVESIEDLAKDNVVYAEIRFAPILHIEKGLTMEEVVEAVLEGLDEGVRRTGISYGLILCALRNQSPKISLDIAKLAVAYRSRGVVALDLAGDEFGNPPKIHLEAFQYIRNQNFNITIHAGEGFGLESIWQALQVCGAHRIGHGTRLIDDMQIKGPHIDKMGSLAHFIQDKRIPIEMCLSSNVGTGAATDFASHPFYTFYKNSFRVFLCTDNRLMSNTTLSKEMLIATTEFNLTLKDLERITLNAMKSAFIHHDERIEIIFNIIKKQYAQLKEEYPQYV